MKLQNKPLVNGRHSKRDLPPRRSVYATITMKVVNGQERVYKVVSHVPFFGNEAQFRRYFSRVFPLLVIPANGQFAVWPTVRVKFYRRAGRVEFIGNDLRTVESTAENFSRSADRFGLLSPDPGSTIAIADAIRAALGIKPTNPLRALMGVTS